MASELDDAFAELQEAKTEATGKEEFVLLAGRKVKALVSEIGGDEIFISGGIAEGADFRILIAQSAVAKEPAKFTDIEVRGNKSQVLQITDVNGVTWEIQAGDPASGQR